LGGRTNGLHSLTAGGLASFPVQSQNREVWVVDPVTKQSWHKSLEDPSSGLSTAQVDSLTNTNPQAYQRGDRLYYVGGYGYDRTTERFLTYDTLSSIDVPALMDWVRAPSPTATAAQSIRQISDPSLRVTGGAMYEVGQTTHLVFGQDFSRSYTGTANGVYTRQVRSFEVVDDGTTLGIANVRATAPLPEFRRRDLTVVRRMWTESGPGGLPVTREGLVALGGVFTESFGAWTVPVTIDADGTPHMADPAQAATFKQGMNNYEAAHLGLFSASRNETHSLLFGGIGYRTYDRATGLFADDPELPFSGNVTSIVADGQGNFSQHLLNEDFPAISAGDGKLLRFGANAEFLPAEGVPAYADGLFNLDALGARPGPTTLGWIYGGIMADAPNRGNTAASSYIFEVTYTPVPEPASFGLLSAAGLGAGGLLARRRRCRRAS
jgi:hypothetical protein